jgi:hypothetical protein
VPRASITLSLAAALALCAACATGSGRTPEGQPAPAKDAFAFQVLGIRDAALNAHDLEAASNAYAANAVVVDADTSAVVLRGREQIRDAHARFLEACPRARVEVLDRVYAEGGRIVTDVQRVHCDRPPPVEGWVRYEISGGAIVRVLKHRSPPFGG